MPCALIFVMVLSLGVVWGANILYVAPVASPSHHLWNRVLALELVKNGHNVTMLTHDKEKSKPPEDYHEIIFEGEYKKYWKFVALLSYPSPESALPVQKPEVRLRSGFIMSLATVLQVMAVLGVYQEAESNLEFEEWTKGGVIGAIRCLYDDWIYELCLKDMQTQGLNTLLDYPTNYKFDLIIFDISTDSCLYPLIDRFGTPPVIGVAPFLLPLPLSNMFGNSLQNLYVPYYATDFPPNMSFEQRFWNFVYIYYEIYYKEFVSTPRLYKLAQEKFGKSIRSFGDVERGIHLLLSNIDPVLDYPIALPPNIIPVGGLHIKPTNKLNKNLSQIVDSAKNGVILFSLGTNIRSDKLSANQKKALLKAFAKLPQLILWKFETDTLENLPKNVVIRKWLPQNDLLCHPNTKLFISHGGALSTQEAMYHGIPVVGLPFFVDQFGNIARMVQRQLALSLDFNNLTYDNVYQTISEVLDNPIYAENMKLISKRYRDQHLSPLERATFWVEHVLRNGKPDHLDLKSRDMPLYQVAGLDLLLFFILALVLVYSVIRFLITTCSFAVGGRDGPIKIKLS